MQLRHPVLSLPLAAGRLLALVRQRLQLVSVSGVLDAELPRGLGDERDRFVDRECGPLEVDVREGEAALAFVDAVEEELGEQGALAHAAGSMDDQWGDGRGGVGRCADVVAQFVEFAAPPLKRLLHEAFEGLQKSGALQCVLKFTDVGQPGHARHAGQPQHRLERVGQFGRVLFGRLVRAARQIGKADAFRPGLILELVEIALQRAPRGLRTGERTQRPIPGIGLEGPYGSCLHAHAHGRAVVEQFEDRAAGGVILAGQAEQHGVEAGEQAGGLPIGRAGVRDGLGTVLACAEFLTQAGSEDLPRLRGPGRHGSPPLPPYRFSSCSSRCRCAFPRPAGPPGRPRPRVR